MALIASARRSDFPRAPNAQSGGVLGSNDEVDERQWYSQTLEALALRPLLYRREHVAEIFTLSAYHQDPEHERYLDAPGPVLEAMPSHSLRGPDSLRALAPLLTGRGGRFR